MVPIIKKPKIRTANIKAILSILTVTIISTVGVIILFYFASSSFIKITSVRSIKNSQNTYNNFTDSAEKAMGLTSHSIVENERISEAFEKRDREALFDLCTPLFKILKRERVTHFYFINKTPDGTTFLRLHKPDLYGDKITRKTFNLAVKRKKHTFGLELGKTAFALRVVHPWYYKGKLIGYLELAEEINKFFDIIKKQTGNDYFVLVKKNIIDKDKYTEMVKNTGKLNMWDEIDNYLVLKKTSPDFPEFDKEVMDKFLLDKNHFLSIKNEGRRKVLGMFPFKDVSGVEVGYVFVLTDISELNNQIITQRFFIFLVLIIFMFITSFLMIFSHIKAEKKLFRYRNHLEELVDERTGQLNILNKDLKTLNSRLIEEISEQELLTKIAKEECKAREKAEKERIEAIKMAERSSKLVSLGRLTASIAHEINNPVLAISNCIQVLKKTDCNNTENKEEALALSEKEIERVRNIISNLLDFHRFDKEKFTEIEISGIISESINMLKWTKKIESINIKTEIDGRFIIRGSESKLKQVFINFILNAAEATQNNTERNLIIKIKKSNERPDKICEIHLIDNGSGIPEKIQNSCFEPFITTKLGNGVGLGLFVSFNIIRSHLGNIRLKKDYKDGAYFIITLPYIKELI